MAIIPVEEIEAELLLLGVLRKQFLRDPQNRRGDGSYGLALVGDLPQARTTSEGLSLWVRQYLTREQAVMLAALPVHQRWLLLKDELLTNEQMLDLAWRLGVGAAPCRRPPDAFQAESLGDLKAWWLQTAKQALAATP